MVSLCLLFMLIATNFSTVVDAAKVSKSNQDVTAYVDGNRTASGENPRVGYCAVHPSKRGEHKNPIIPFGTVLNITKIVDPYTGEKWDMLYHPYYDEINALQVQDIGDVNYNFSTYWIDIWYGISMKEEAKEFGERKIDYFYYN